MIGLALILLAALQTPYDPPPGEDFNDDHVAEYKVAPAYPRLAATTGAAGLCWISYDVDAQGRPSNYCTRCTARSTATADLRANALAAEQSARGFVHASKVAVSQWRYGQDQRPLDGVRTVIVFLMEGQDESDLPPDPRGMDCAERPTS